MVLNGSTNRSKSFLKFNQLGQFNFDLLISFYASFEKQIILMNRSHCFAERMIFLSRMKKKLFLNFELFFLVILWF